MSVTTLYTEFTVKQPDLVELVNVASKFASTDGARPILECLWFVPENGYYTVFATDSYKLIRLDTEIEAPTNDGENIGINAKWLLAATKQMAKNSPVVFRVDRSEVTITDFNMTTSTRREEGNMPGFDSIIPKESVGVSPGTFNPKHMKAIMTALCARKTDSPIEIWQMDPLKPAVFRLCGPDRSHLTGWAVLMPQRESYGR